MRARLNVTGLAVLLIAIVASAAADDTTCPAVARTTREHERIRCCGLARARVGDVVLKGIVRTAKGFTAMLEDCVDRQNWTVVVGQRFYDGRLTAIDAESVTFEVESDLPASPAPKPTTKRLTLKPTGK